MLRLAALWLLVVGCAKVGTPTGGEVDRSPPRVVAHRPSADATDVPVDAPVEVEFSEAMDPERSQEAVFVAPAFGVRMRWQGRHLRLEFAGGLQPRRTYVITVGTGARDLRGNALERSSSYAFATGPQLDQGRIQGRVFRDDQPKAAAYVWAYDLEHLTGRPGVALPEYRTQSGQDGGYEFARLAEGTYRILAFVDADRNQRWDPGEDLALPAADARVSAGGEAQAGDLALFPAQRPAPRLLRLQSLCQRRLLLQFDREVAPEAVALTLDGLPTEGLYGAPQEKTKVYAQTAAQAAGRTYAVAALQVEGHAIRWRDPLRGTDRPDRTLPAVWRQYPQPGQELAPDDSLELVFTRALERAVPRDVWVASDSTQAVPGSWRWQGMTRLCFVPTEPWPPGTWRLRGQVRQFRDPEGLALRDSVVGFAFKALGHEELGALRGRVRGEGAAGAWVVARDADRPRARRARTGPDGGFVLEGLCPGKYTVVAFADLDGDGQLDGGSLDPYTPAEPYCRYPEPAIVPRSGNAALLELVFR